MDEYLVSKKSKKPNNFFKLNISKYILKFLILVVLTLGLLIALKVSTNFKSFFYKHIYDNHLSFARINNYYQELFGSPMPFKDLFVDKEKTVFSEKINYNTMSQYYDGISLGVTNNLLVPVLETGMVVFVGEKENYGQTVIIEQIDGVDVWYGNLTNINVSMYDYVEKGSVLASTLSDKLYLVFKKDGENYNYEAYL